MNAPAQKMRASLSNHPEMETVNEIVDWMEQPSVISECYQTWWKFQCQIEDFYSEKERQRPSLSQQKEFRSIKSAVIQEAENVRTVTVTFENAGMNKSTEFSVLPYNCWELWMVIQDDTAVMEKQDETAAQIISKAQNGDPFAQYLAGRLYRNSLVFVLDGVDAADWFDQAAHQGVVMAQYELGMLPLQ